MRHALSVMLVAVAAVIALWSQPAFAIDLTGTYEGGQSCKGVLADGTSDKFDCCDELVVTQVGATLNMEAGGITYFASTVELAGKPEKGVMTAVSCDTTNALPSGSEMGVFEPVAQSSGKTTIKGESAFFADGDHFVCKWNYKRISTDDPVVGACPP